MHPAAWRSAGRGGYKARIFILSKCRDARQLEVVTRALAGVLVAPRVQPAAWYSAAEAATAAIYALHPAPGALCAAIVHQLAGPAISERTQLLAL